MSAILDMTLNNPNPTHSTQTIFSIGGTVNIESWPISGSTDCAPNGHSLRQIGYIIILRVTRFVRLKDFYVE